MGREERWGTKRCWELKKRERISESDGRVGEQRRGVGETLKGRRGRREKGGEEKNGEEMGRTNVLKSLLDSVYHQPTCSPLFPTLWIPELSRKALSVELPLPTLLQQPPHCLLLFFLHDNLIILQLTTIDGCLKFNPEANQECPGMCRVMMLPV